MLRGPGHTFGPSRKQSHGSRGQSRGNLSRYQKNNGVASRYLKQASSQQSLCQDSWLGNSSSLRHLPYNASGGTLPSSGLRPGQVPADHINRIIANAGREEQLQTSYTVRPISAPRVAANRSYSRPSRAHLRGPSEREGGSRTVVRSSSYPALSRHKTAASSADLYAVPVSGEKLPQQRNLRTHPQYHLTTRPRNQNPGLTTTHQSTAGSQQLHFTRNPTTLGKPKNAIGHPKSGPKGHTGGSAGNGSGGSTRASSSSSGIKEPMCSTLSASRDMKRMQHQHHSGSSGAPNFYGHNHTTFDRRSHQSPPRGDVVSQSQSFFSSKTASPPPGNHQYHDRSPRERCSLLSESVNNISHMSHPSDMYSRGYHKDSSILNTSGAATSPHRSGVSPNPPAGKEASFYGSSFLDYNHNQGSRTMHQQHEGAHSNSNRATGQAKKQPQYYAPQTHHRQEHHYMPQRRGSGGKDGDTRFTPQQAACERQGDYSGYYPYRNYPDSPTRHRTDPHDALRKFNDCTDLRMAPDNHIPLQLRNHRRVLIDVLESIPSTHIHYTLLKSIWKENDKYFRDHENDIQEVEILRHRIDELEKKERQYQRREEMTQREIAELRQAASKREQPFSGSINIHQRTHQAMCMDPDRSRRTPLFHAPPLRDQQQPPPNQSSFTHATTNSMYSPPDVNEEPTSVINCDPRRGYDENANALQPVTKKSALAPGTSTATYGTTLAQSRNAVDEVMSAGRSDEPYLREHDEREPEFFDPRGGPTSFLGFTNSDFHQPMGSDMTPRSSQDTSRPQDADIPQDRRQDANKSLDSSRWSLWEDVSIGPPSKEIRHKSREISMPALDLKAVPSEYISPRDNLISVSADADSVRVSELLGSWPSRHGSEMADDTNRSSIAASSRTQQQHEI